MYGLVNQAVQGLITKNFGIEKWLEIKEKAGIVDPLFVSMQSYDDSVTFDLVSAASEILKIDSSALLEAFGEYWVLYTAEEGYGEMLQMAGRSFPEFLGNLNHLHRRVGDILPKLLPPKFECEIISEQVVQLHYTSHRDGLNHMVIGLIKGLGKRFKLNNVKIELIESIKKDDLNNSIFYISWDEEKTGVA